MVPKDQKDKLESFRLPLQETAIVVVVHQAPNIACEDEIFGTHGNIERRVLLIDL
jgi:hypothetical protein